MQSISQAFQGPDATQKQLVMLAALLALATLPLDVTQLVFACAGAIAYAMIMYVQGAFDSKNAAKKDTRKPKSNGVAPGGGKRGLSAAAPPAPQVERNQFSFAATKATDLSKPFEAEVAQLLDDIMPTRESALVADKLAKMVKQSISRSLPEAEVVGFANANLSCSRAFGVAVPDVDIVLSISPDVASARLHERPSGRSSNSFLMDERKLQKAALRVCTDRLVSGAGFKFRRSAFRGTEPKITLLVPSTRGVTEENVPIDIYVNAATPFQHTALLTECGSFDARARELLMMIRCWAKCRGICHAAKGHLSPYLWSLLGIYFLQVTNMEGGPVLPPLTKFSKTSNLIPSKAACPESASKTDEARPAKQGEAVHASTASLFKDFMKFYNQDFDLKMQKISVRCGQSFSVAAASAGPSFEDPFQPEQTLGNDMPVPAQIRLLDELKRADDLCSKGASLSIILENWSPTDADGNTAKDAEDDE